MRTLTLSSARPPALARALTASSSVVTCVPSKVKEYPVAESSYFTSAFWVYDAIATAAYGNGDAFDETTRFPTAIDVDVRVSDVRCAIIDYSQIHIDSPLPFSEHR